MVWVKADDSKGATVSGSIKSLQPTRDGAFAIRVFWPRVAEFTLGETNGISITHYEHHIKIHV